MSQVHPRAITTAALLVVLAVFWLGLHSRTKVKNESGTSAVAHSENAGRADPVRATGVLNSEKTNPVIEPDSAKANQQAGGLGGTDVDGASTSQEIGASDSSHVPIPIESRYGGPNLRRHFVLSESVKQECARIAHLVKADCNDHLNAIARLENEVRDPTWADATEESIRSVVDSQPDSRVRSLECRSSICALEVESPTSVFSQRHFQAISARVSDIDRIFAYEYLGSGVRIKVTSITFQRL